MEYRLPPRKLVDDRLLTTIWAVWRISASSGDRENFVMHGWILKVSVSFGLIFSRIRLFIYVIDTGAGPKVVSAMFFSPN